MRNHSDKELVKRFQRGDDAAFATFSERHRDRLYRLASVWLGDRDLAKDAVQEAFLRSYTGLGQFRFRAAPATWLIRVCRNVCLELARRHPRTVDTDAAAELPAHEVREADLPAYLNQALAALPERQRDVVVLRLLEEMSVRDTAAVMGCREGTVKAHLAKASANMRTQLEAWGMDLEHIEARNHE